MNTQGTGPAGVVAPRGRGANTVSRFSKGWPHGSQPGKQYVATAENWGPATGFVEEWNLAADRFLASGWWNPLGFTDLVDSLRMCGEDLPDPTRRTTMYYIYHQGERNARCAVDELAAVCHEDRDRLAEIVFAYGTDVNLSTFARWVMAFSVRAKAYGERDKLLDFTIADIPTIGRLCREELACVV